ncbi:hypothetical protein WA026_018408 [Henosepilachna vigintioctopunctata]|uniref:Uncharacterized protein n=1 Tax=Henosepilachna vigintioctopunctata TaxID=420089 RepID=A0AAW1V3S2_9CUCU
MKIFEKFRVFCLSRLYQPYGFFFEKIFLESYLGEFETHCSDAVPYELFMNIMNSFDIQIHCPTTFCLNSTDSVTANNLVSTLLGAFMPKIEWLFTQILFHKDGQV